MERWVNKTAPLMEALVVNHEQEVRENFWLEPDDPMAYVKIFQILKPPGRLWEYYLLPVDRMLGELATAVRRDDAEIEKRLKDTAPLIEALLSISS